LDQREGPKLLVGVSSKPEGVVQSTLEINVKGNVKRANRGIGPLAAFQAIG